MSLYKITFFVPESHVEQVKQAMFDAGAGKIGNYDCCSWQVKGEGQFRPLLGSQAFIGEVNAIKKIEEFRVEMVCDKTKVKEAINALLQAHPYETPAYDILQTVDF